MFARPWRSFTASVALIALSAPSTISAQPRALGLRNAPEAQTLARRSNGRAIRPDALCAAGTGSFVGGGENNVAGGNDSGIVSGVTNHACGSYDAIGAGALNDIFPNGGYDYSSFIGAGQDNAIFSNGLGGTYESFIGAGYGNTVTAWEAGVGAGNGNLVGPAGAASFVGGGISNTSNGEFGFVGAGQSNSAGGTEAFVGAGDRNSTTTYSGVVAGSSNDAGGTYSFVGAGLRNTAGAEYGVVAGGDSNSLSGPAGAIGGGAGNKVAGEYGTVPGGSGNSAAGIGSFAAGSAADALHNGTFVWSDGSATTAVKTSAPYQFVARASGGFYLFTNAAEKSGVELAAGSGTWASLSDRTMKSGIEPLDSALVLDKVAALPVSEWSYNSERGVRHVGPMAQDFYAAFRVGEDDRHITSLDEDGVALAAIKGLNTKTQRDYDRLDRLETKAQRDNARLERENASLKDALAALKTQVAALARSTSHEAR